MTTNAIVTLLVLIALVVVPVALMVQLAYRDQSATSVKRVPPWLGQQAEDADDEAA